MTRAVATCLGWLSIGVLCLGLSPGTEDWGSELGVVERIDDLICLSTPGKIQAGDLVQLFELFEKQAVVVAVVEEADSKACREASHSTLQGPFHRLRSGKSPSELQLPAIAVLGGRIPLTIRNGSTAVDLDGDGVGETLRSCTSREGLHLTVWSGEPLTGTRRWRSCDYRGYDADPTCTERVY